MTLVHDRHSIHVTSTTDEGSALCSIADKIPLLTTYPSLSPTQRWSKSPTCPPSSSTWCAWKGVTCVSSSVTAIDLSSSSGFGNLVATNGLGKTALSRLTALTNVVSFNMAGNSLTGNIPTTIGAMTSLTYLDLSSQTSNQFYGSIPKQFSALTNLLSLQLHSNKLTTTIPSFIGSALTKLTFLGLYSNSLTGTITTTMSALTQLLSLRVDTNLLQGTIPAFFGNTLTQMTTLNLTSNYFTGTVPVALSNIGTLTLTYATNCLVGTGSPTSQTHCLTPTGQPSSKPSRVPTIQPSNQPSVQPTQRPTNTTLFSKVVTYQYTGAVQTYTVPVGVTLIKITAAGAAGGGGYNSNRWSIGGLGGYISTLLSVVPGQVYYVYVGGMGASRDVYYGISHSSGGYNGGGSCSNPNTGEGGGGTDVRTSANDITTRVVVSGGGEYFPIITFELSIDAQTSHTHRLITNRCYSATRTDRRRGVKLEQRWSRWRLSRRDVLPCGHWWYSNCWWY